MNKVRLGFIGCGSVVRVMFGPFFRDLSAGEVTAVADVDEASARYVQELYSVPRAYTDYRELLEQAPVDAVVVGTPPHLHEEQVIAAARAGKHVLCEKPMAPTGAASVSPRSGRARGKTPASPGSRSSRAVASFTICSAIPRISSDGSSARSRSSVPRSTS